jgi:hypothetical protein
VAASNGCADFDGFLRNFGQAAFPKACHAKGLHRPKTANGVKNLFSNASRADHANRRVLFSSNQTTNP